MPVGLATFAIGWFALTLPRKRSTTPVDYLGILALSATTTSLIFFTDFGGRDGWGSWQALSLLAAFAVSAAAFIAVELRAAEPIIPMSLFRNRTFVVATSLGLAVGLGMFSAIAFMPTFLQMLRAVGGELGPAHAADDRGHHRHHPGLGVGHREDRPVQDLHRSPASW